MSVRSLVVGLTLVSLAFVTGAAAKEWPSKVPSGAERGRELYDRHCMACHGVKAAGDGPAAAAMVVPVPDFSEGFGKRKREELVRAVLRGKGLMPSFEQSLRDLTPYSGDVKEYAENVVDHMENLAKGLVPEEVEPEAPDEDEGEDLEENQGQ